MQRPLQVKTIIAFILFFLLFFLSAALTARAAEKSTLTGMAKQENPNHTKMTFTFSALPKYETQRSGQRVDLTFDDVQVDPQLKRLPEDETVVKILLAQKRKQLLTSILLRRTPKEVVIEAQRNPDRIVMDIYWEGDDSARPAVAFKIADMPPKKAGRRAARFQRKSPWEGRWYDFYRHYRSDWKLNLPVSFSLPRLPRLIDDENSPLLPLQRHADEKMFLSLLQTAATLNDLDEQQRYLRDILVAEAQLRTDAVEAANARLRQLSLQGGSEQVRVGYLTAYGEAVAGQPLVARIQLLQLMPTLEASDPYASYIRLLLAETGLASGLDKNALEELQGQKGDWNGALLVFADLRTADALAGSGNREAALEIYRDLTEETGLFESDPFSCNRAAHSAFRERDYPLALDLYRKLAEVVKESSDGGLVLFATGVSAYESGDLGWGMIGLQRATLDYPGTEGADRATLRMLDLEVIKDGELGLARVVAEYGKLAEISRYRSVREESAFKEALGHYLLMEHQLSVAELMDFRRNFNSSPLRRETDLLLLEQLPRAVHQLMEEKNDLQAVVLVEKNRKLLLGSGFDQDFLYDLATAFEKLGLYERASRVLLYLFDRTSGHPDQERVYLPLARNFLKRNELTMASDYAGRYLKKYPKGDNAGALFGILLDAFKKQKRDEELLEWLDRKSRPRSVELETRAAGIYWKLNRYADVIDSLEWIRNAGEVLEVKEMALLGEAYYQLGRNKQSEKIYRTLMDDPAYAARAGYRSAQLRLRGGDQKGALTLLNRVAEGDAEGPWGQLARDLLIQEQR